MELSDAPENIPSDRGNHLKVKVQSFLCHSSSFRNVVLKIIYILVFYELNEREIR